MVRLKEGNLSPSLFHHRPIPACAGPRSLDDSKKIPDDFISISKSGPITSGRVCSNSVTACIPRPRTRTVERVLEVVFSIFGVEPTSNARRYLIPHVL